MKIDRNVSEALRTEARHLHLIENQHEMSGMGSEEVVEEVTKRVSYIKDVVGDLK